MSALLLGKVLGVLLNTLTADGKYDVQDWENWQLPMIMKLSEKHKTFPEFFVPYLESTSNCKHFEKKMIVIPNVFPTSPTMNYLVRPLCENLRFGTRFGKQHVKVSQKLAKSPWENFFHVFPSFWMNLKSTCQIAMRALLSCFFIVSREFHLQNLSPSVR